MDTAFRSTIWNKECIDHSRRHCIAGVARSPERLRGCVAAGIASSPELRGSAAHRPRGLGRVIVHGHTVDEDDVTGDVP